MFLISAEVSGNIMEAARSPIGKEPVKRMKIPAVIKNKFENMKYRHKLTILLVTASLVPMILLVLYSHDRMSSLLREKEMEDMSSILEQTGEGIDSQIEVFSSLLNYLTYSPDIEDLITEKNMDNYQAYIKYTEVADPLLSVPKSYHDAIIQIQLFAESTAADCVRSAPFSPALHARHQACGYSMPPALPPTAVAGSLHLQYSAPHLPFA